MQQQNQSESYFSEKFTNDRRIDEQRRLFYNIMKNKR